MKDPQSNSLDEKKEEEEEEGEEEEEEEDEREEQRGRCQQRNSGITTYSQRWENFAGK